MLFAEDPSSTESKYPENLYGYYKHEVLGESFESHFEAGIEEFIDCADNLQEAGDKLVTGESIELFTAMDEDDIVSMNDLKSGRFLGGFDTGPCLVIDYEQSKSVFQYVSRSDKDKSTRFLQLFHNDDHVNSSLIPDEVRGSNIKVIGSLLVAKECKDYFVATEYQLRSNNRMRMISSWNGVPNAGSEDISKVDFRRFALYSLGEIHCDLLPEDAE